jgi:hypothetical protein
MSQGGSSTYGPGRDNLHLLANSVMSGLNGMGSMNVMNLARQRTYDPMEQSGANSGHDFDYANQKLAYDTGVFNYGQLAAQAKRKQEAFDLFKQLLSGGSGGNAFSNWGNVSGYLNQAQQQRDPSYALNRMQDLSSADSQAIGAMQDMGRQQIQNNYLGALRDLRSSTSDRSLSPEAAASMRSDLLRQRIRSGKDLQQGLIADESNRQQSAINAYGNMLQNVNSLNSQNANYAAQLASQNQQFNAGQLQQYLGTLLGLGG